MIAPANRMMPADQSAAIDVHVDCCGLTDVGNVRRTNEDQFLILELRRSLFIRQTSMISIEESQRPGEKKGHLFVVADGLGGHAGGREASRLAVDAVVDHMLDVVRLDLQGELNSIPERCRDVIHEAASQMPELRGMGTTLTIAYVFWPRLYVVHAGDSRCYVLRSPRIEQITTDHTRAQQLVGSPGM